jgi:hypothetical protein
MKNRIASLDNLMLQVGKRADRGVRFRPAPASDRQRHRFNALLPPIEGLRGNIDVEGGNVFPLPA